MSSSAIIDLTGISQSFPSSLDYEIQRENVWNTTSALFRGGAEIIFIEGDEGLGKTTLMAQLARKDPYKSFTLFVKSASRFTYDTENLRFDLSNQITWLLDMKELGDPADADESYWKNIVLRLHRQARRKNEIYYFIIDGLAELPDEAAKTRGNLLDMLPLGMTQFRFILSGDAAVFPEAQRKRLKYKSLVLSPFILDETYKFFGGLNVSREEIEQIHRTCNGIPGHLASIRRLVASGTGAGQIIDEAFDKLPDLFELEWRKTDPDNNVQKLILAVLAFDKKRHTIGDLQKLLQLEPARVRELLGNLSFIEISPQDEPSYVSETFRRFAAERLKSEREKVDELLIRNMMSMPQSEESLLRLTGYLRKANRYEDILNYLSAENLERLLECTKSLSPVRDKVDLGLETAVHLHRDGEVFRFAIAKAVLTSLYEGYDGKAEIQARISLNDYESAVMLAQRTVLKEDRLHLLAVIAKAKHIQGLEPEPEIVEQIRQLYSEIDFGRLGSRAIEIAADLIGTETQLAIEMVEKAAQTRGGENILDTAFVRLSLAVILKPKNQKVTPGAVEKITERIGNPELRDLIAAIASFTRTSSALEVISLAKTMKQTSEALFVLRQWAMANDTREDAVEVIVYGLERAIGVTDYSPNATVWRELSTPLASIPPNERIKELVGMIDAQKTTVERLGPSEDVVRLQLNLVKAELRYDVSAATSRMVESYFYICSISDLSVKASCLAWLVATLVNLDGDGSIEKKEGVLGIAKAELDDSIKRLIAETAAHFDSLSGVINAICTACPQEALDIAQTLNTQSRRDRALSLIFKSIVETSFGDSEMSLLEGILDRIVNPRYVDESVSYLARDWDRIGKFKSLDRGTIIRMIRMVDRIHDSQYRCKAYARSIVLLKQLADDKLRHIADNEQLSRLNNSWESIDRVWVKSELGFEIASSLATTALETAKEYATKSELLSSHEMLGSSYAADTYIKNLELAVRSFPGLLPRHIEGPNDWKSLEELIGQIPSPGEQAKLWADLAVRCYLVGRTDYCKEIVSKYVRHRLSIIDKADKRYYYGVMRDCATALYLTHHRTALDDMAALPNIIQD